MSVNEEREQRQSELPDVPEVVAENHETIECVATDDDRWGRGARQMLREADNDA